MLPDLASYDNILRESARYCYNRQPLQACSHTRRHCTNYCSKKDQESSHCTPWHQKPTRHHSSVTLLPRPRPDFVPGQQPQTHFREKTTGTAATAPPSPKSIGKQIEFDPLWSVRNNNDILPVLPALEPQHKFHEKTTGGNRI